MSKPEPSMVARTEADKYDKHALEHVQDPRRICSNGYHGHERPMYSGQKLRYQRE